MTIKNHTILIVENDAITAMELQSELQKLGYEVPLTVSSGEEAIQVTKDLHPDLILMNVNLQGKIDGTKAAYEISRYQSIPIIFLTAQDDAVTFPRARLTVPFYYLTKPYDFNELRIAVELVLFKRSVEIDSDIETIRIKNEFLNNMSHELLTPLNGINGFIQLVHDSDKTEFKPMAKEALVMTQHLINLIHMVLKLTEFESGETDFLPITFNLREFIENLLQTLSKPHNIKFVIDLSPDMAQILFDPKIIKEILYQYLTNAIKFSPDGGTITIRIYLDNKKNLHIEIADQGIGIAEEDIPKLFQAFKQLDMSSGKKYQGAGLGLAFVRSIIDSQAGQIGAYSELGKGSTFYAVLPYTHKND